MDNQVLEKIQEFAGRAHGDQRRKYSDEKYIEHPVRVMKICREYTSKGAILAAALLHDVLEDTEVGSEEIHEFLREAMGHGPAKKTLQLVEQLTDEYEKKNYPQWNRDKRKFMESERMAKISADAQTIKYADIIDNTPDIVNSDPRFGRRYLQEVKTLLEKMTKGDPKLRYRAKKVVEESARSLIGQKKAPKAY